MKAILQAIKPRHCELIAKREKEIEVRKTRPKIQTPFKVYIYCTKDKWQHFIQMPDKSYRIYNGKAYGEFDKNLKFTGEAHDKVIGEYVCDEIGTFDVKRMPDNDLFCERFAIMTQHFTGDFNSVEATCLSTEELYNYSNGKILYGWHISDLVIYDKPKELSEFGKECNLDCPSVHCPYWKYQRVNADEWDYDCNCNNIRPLTRPPQSWCYVEEV